MTDVRLCSTHRRRRRRLVTRPRPLSSTPSKRRVFARAHLHVTYAYPVLSVRTDWFYRQRLLPTGRKSRAKSSCRGRRKSTFDRGS